MSKIINHKFSNLKSRNRQMIFNEYNGFIDVVGVYFQGIIEDNVFKCQRFANIFFEREEDIDYLEEILSLTIRSYNHNKGETIITFSRNEKTTDSVRFDENETLMLLAECYEIKEKLIELSPTDNEEEASNDLNKVEESTEGEQEESNNE